MFEEFLQLLFVLVFVSLQCLPGVILIGVLKIDYIFRKPIKGVTDFVPFSRFCVNVNYLRNATSVGPETWSL